MEDFHLEPSRQEFPTRFLSSWMPFPTAIDEGPLHATVTVAVELEGSLIRLQAQYLATPDALRMGAASMIERLLTSWMPFPGTAFDAAPVYIRHGDRGRRVRGVAHPLAGATSCHS